MKLLLVIDVADDEAEAYEDFTVDYDLRGTPKDDQITSESIKYVEDCPLRPLPEKSNYLPKDDHVYSKAEITAYIYGITVGRNEVIDEIIGETE